MINVKRFLLSRKTVITLIILILLSVLIGYLFPQRMTSSQLEIEQWQRQNPFWAPVYLTFQLDHVYTSWWFSSLLSVFLIMLLLSTCDQIILSRKKTFGKGIGKGKAICTASLSETEMTGILGRSGFRLRYSDGNNLRYIKNAWGFWGNVLLHLGIVLVIASSLIMTITEKRGLLHLVEGETYLPGNPWIVEESGLFATRFILPVTIRLDKVIAAFWENDDVKNVSTHVIITDDSGNEQAYELGINRAFTVEGLRLYQGRRFGKAFFVVFTDKQGEHFKAIVQIENPRKRDKPSYGNFFLDEIPYMIKAKFYADAEMKSMESDTPLLTLRLVTREQSIGAISPDSEKDGLVMQLEEKVDLHGEATLKPGESRPLGDYVATLVRTEDWSGVIFVSSTGMTGIFIGFFIIFAGISVTYFFPPREVTAVKEGDEYTLFWKASRFEKFYEDEIRKIKSILEDGNKNAQLP